MSSEVVCQNPACQTVFIPHRNTLGKYCSRSCSSTVNNAKTRRNKFRGICKSCGEPCSSSRVFCSPECRRKTRRDVESLTEKKCPTCNEIKNLDEFHNAANSWDGKQPLCKPCNISKVQNWQQENPEKYEILWRKSLENRDNFERRAKKHGLTVDELTVMYEQSKGLCDICGNPPAKWLVIDHCHTSQTVRGLLCGNCNTALGLLKDNIQSLENAIQYLIKPR